MEFIKYPLISEKPIQRNRYKEKERDNFIRQATVILIVGRHL